MPRTFTVYEPRPNGLSALRITHQGFNLSIDTETPLVAIICADGEMETWALDEPSSVHALLAYYAADGFTVKLIGVFQHIGD